MTICCIKIMDKKINEINDLKIIFDGTICEHVRLIMALQSKKHL